MARSIREQLGLVVDGPIQWLARELVRQDEDLVRQLVAARKSARLSQGDVANRLGISQPAVSDFERAGGDPRLSTVRRYALAVGAMVEHRVSDAAKSGSVDEQADEPDDGWIDLHVERKGIAHHAKVSPVVVGKSPYAGAWDSP